MSCGCTSITTPSSTTCGSCGYNCTSCICPPDPIVMPTVACEDPAKCTELYSLDCIKYTGNDIKCSSEASTLYPNVTHIVATNGDTLSNILNNINNQLCYLFSSDFINQMFTNIQNNSTLSELICLILDGCGAAPTSLICPTTSVVTYNVSSPQNYLQASFSYVPYATSYNYKFYVEDTPGSNTYTFITSGSVQQPSIALPISINSPLTGTSYTSTKKYIVLVQAVSSTLTNSGPDLEVTYAGSTLTSLQYNTIVSSFSATNCGFNLYTPTESPAQTCQLSIIQGNFKFSAVNPNALQFTFTHETLNPAYISPTFYKVHWYLKSAFSFPITYNYQNNATISFVSGQVQTINLYKPQLTSSGISKTSYTITITTNNHGLTSGSTINISTGVTGLPAGDYIITVLSTSQFTFVVANNTSLSGTPTITYKPQLMANDSVVVMIYTMTNDDLCYNGVNQKGTFSKSEIISYLSNAQYNVYENL